MNKQDSSNTEKNIVNSFRRSSTFDMGLEPLAKILLALALICTILCLIPYFGLSLRSNIAPEVDNELLVEPLEIFRPNYNNKVTTFIENNNKNSGENANSSEEVTDDLSNLIKRN